MIHELQINAVWILNTASEMETIAGDESNNADQKAFWW